MYITCLDLEGILIPEIWVGLSRMTGIEELGLTTRDVEDYGELMKHRLAICKKHSLGLIDIQRVVEKMKPLEGAQEFLSWLRQRCEVVILSDTFREFVKPMMIRLKYPTLFCPSLILNRDQHILDYQLRLPDQKRMAVRAFQGLNFQVAAVGDSFNDIAMLEEADHSILFKPSEQVAKSYPDYPVTANYQELKNHLQRIIPAD